MRNAWVARGGWRWSVLGLVAAGLTFARTARIGFVGHDNYPILIASRIRSWADFVGTFTEPLMDGRYAGEFYRPLLNLSFAVDHALWGTAAWGFQLTNAILFAGCGWAGARARSPEKSPRTRSSAFRRPPISPIQRQIQEAAGLGGRRLALRPGDTYVCPVAGAGGAWEGPMDPEYPRGAADLPFLDERPLTEEQRSRTVKALLDQGFSVADIWEIAPTLLSPQLEMLPLMSLPQN